MVDNNYSEENKASLFFNRSNGLANGSNVMKLKVDQQYCEKLYLVGDFVVSGDGAELEFTASGATAAYDFRYINVTVIDQSGNEAGSTDSGTSAVVTVDTSALNPQDLWTVKVRMSTEQNISLECACAAHYEILVNDPSSNPTVSVNEVTDVQRQVIAVFQADGTTPIADAGAAYSLGLTIPQSATPYAFSIVVKNTGENVLELTTPLTVDADVLTAVVAQFDNYIYPNQTITVTGTVDVSGTGAKTGKVTILSNDPSNASYEVNISYTVV